MAKLYNRKEMYGLFRKEFYPKKVGRKELYDPLSSEFFVMRMKVSYWNLMFKLAYKRNTKAWVSLGKLFLKKSRLQKRRLIERTTLCIEAKNVFESVLNNIRIIGNEKFCKAVKEAVEKENKAKKLRRKWKKMLTKSKIRKVGNLISRWQRKDIWEKFEEKKYLIEVILKEKIEIYNNNASRRNEMLISLFKTAANNIQNDLSYRNQPLWLSTKDLTASLNVSHMPDSSSEDSESAGTIAFLLLPPAISPDLLDWDTHFRSISSHVLSFTISN
jgi:hypothetical protein